MRVCSVIKLATRQVLMQKFAQSVAFMRQTKNFSLVLTLFLVGGLCSCGKSGLNANNFRLGANVTPIREIKKPAQDNQAQVYIQGKVAKHAPLMKQRVYQIDDSTGKIWVVTNQTNLKEGQEVVFRAKVRYKSIPLAGKEFGEVYLEEE
jgi:hypothetical protein